MSIIPPRHHASIGSDIPPPVYYPSLTAQPQKTLPSHNYWLVGVSGLGLVEHAGAADDGRNTREGPNPRHVSERASQDGVR